MFVVVVVVVVVGGGGGCGFLHDCGKCYDPCAPIFKVMLVCLFLLLWGKDETPGIEDLGSVLRNSSIQTLRLSAMLTN